MRYSVLIVGEHTCVTDPACIPTLHVENHADQTIYFLLACARNFTKVLEVAAGTTQSYPAVFPFDVGSPGDEVCVLLVSTLNSIRFAYELLFYCSFYILSFHIICFMLTCSMQKFSNISPLLKNVLFSASAFTSMKRRVCNVY